MFSLGLSSTRGLGRSCFALTRGCGRVHSNRNILRLAYCCHSPLPKLGRVVILRHLDKGHTCPFCVKLSRVWSRTIGSHERRPDGSADATAAGAGIPNEHRKTPKYNPPTMDRHIPHARRWAPANQDRRGSRRCDGVGRADADGEVAHPSSGQVAYQDVDGSGGDDGPTDMGYDAGDHRADMHVSEACCGSSHRIFLASKGRSGNGQKLDLLVLGMFDSCDGIGVHGAIEIF